MKTYPELKNLKILIESYFDLKDLKTKSRKRELVYARQLFFLIARQNTRLSLSEIGAYLNYNHGIVLYSINTIKDLMSYDKDVVKDVKSLTGDFSGLKDNIYYDAVRLIEKNINNIEFIEIKINDTTYKF